MVAYMAIDDLTGTRNILQWMRHTINTLPACCTPFLCIDLNGHVGRGPEEEGIGGDVQGDQAGQWTLAGVPSARFASGWHALRMVSRLAGMEDRDGEDRRDHEQRKHAG